MLAGAIFKSTKPDESDAERRELEAYVLSPSKHCTLDGTWLTPLSSKTCGRGGGWSIEAQGGSTTTGREGKEGRRRKGEIW